MLTSPSVLFQISISDLEVSRKSLIEKIQIAKRLLQDTMQVKKDFMATKYRLCLI